MEQQLPTMRAVRCAGRPGHGADLGKGEAYPVSSASTLGKAPRLLELPGRSWGGMGDTPMGGRPVPFCTARPSLEAVTRLLIGASPCRQLIAQSLRHILHMLAAASGFCWQHLDARRQGLPCIPFAGWGKRADA